MSVPLSAKQEHHLPALTGIRFFAIFHIFLFHLWVLYDLDKDPKFATLMSGFSSLPQSLVTFLSHGWLSTSFFFMLSGFIQGYLYWLPDGSLSVSKRNFFIARLSRIYPIHLIVLVISAGIMAPFVLSNDVWLPMASLVATATLMQSWIPPLVPMWSWPTWTISALLFLYLVTPLLMKVLHAVSSKNQRRLLFALPVISLVPTAIYAYFFPFGTQTTQNWQIFIGSTPIFWLGHYVAGLLLSRTFKISRYQADWRPKRRRWVSFGDVALVAVIGIALVPGIEQEPIKYYFRHGLIMPLYLIVIYDLARGQGLAAKLFSLPGTGAFGEIGYSIFIWQNLIMVLCWGAVNFNPAAGNNQLIYASVGAILLGFMSTYLIEKPLARLIRRRCIRQPK